MAPVHARRYYYSLPPPRHPKAPAGTPPVAVSARISFTVFMQLFAGTVGIFILAVLIWKVGRLFRSLTRHRLSRPGRKTTARYARTWYGWVSLPTHKSFKRLFSWCSITYYELTAWQTSRADYHWVWWDPDQKGFQEYRQRRQKVRRWLPRWLHSYEFTPADEIWNPGGPPATATLSVEFVEKGALEPVKTATGPRRKGVSVAGRPQTFPGSLQTRRVRPSMQPLRDHVCLRPEAAGDILRTGHQHVHLILRRARSDMSTSSLRAEQGHNGFQAVYYEGKRRLASITEHEEFARTSLSLAPALQENIHSMISVRAHCQLASSDSNTGNENRSTAYRIKRKSKRYQAWAARLQIHSDQQAHRVREPPGTPNSNLLSSFASEEAIVIGSIPELSGALNSNVSKGWQPASDNLLCTPTMRHTTDHASVEVTSHVLDLGCVSAGRQVSAAGSEGRQALTSRIHHPAPSTNAYCAPRNLQNEQTSSLPLPRKVRFHGRTQSAVTLHGLTDWEVRLIDGLDRRLEWLANEMDPGRKPYNFAVIANHWLNRETWLVYDPISRVSKNTRRKLGDPRFNVPYPEPEWGPKPKFPATRQRRAQTPHIDSWRAAVNNCRKASGTRGTLKLVELFDGSVEDPPDGKVDPASWILPKPPQGFALSRREGEAYYEGGAGWQETLEDWRRVRRGYRMRKAVFEGRVNRTWLREAAAGFADGCRSVSSKVTAHAATYKKGG